MRRIAARVLVATAVGVLGFGLVVVATLVVRSSLTEVERLRFDDLLAGRTGLLVLLAVVLAGVFGLAFDVASRRYARPVRRVAEELGLLLTANPGHRVRVAGPPEIITLTHAVNRVAEQSEALRSDVDARIADARADVEEERNRLAALMSELSQSVLVCNLEGRILLYNVRARQMLGRGVNDDDGGGSSLVGLGRSVFGIVDRRVLLHALDTLQRRLERESASPLLPTTQFTTATEVGHLLHVQMAPVVDRQHAIGGFVLTLEDVSREIEAGRSRDLLLQSLLERTRASVGTMRAAIESLLDHPDLDAARRERLKLVARDEAVSLSARLDAVAAQSAGLPATQWPLEDMRASDLVLSITRRLDQTLGVRVVPEPVDPGLWLQVDSYMVVQAMAYLAARLKEELGVGVFGLRVVAGDRLAQLDLTWWAAPLLQAETMASWERDPMDVAGGAGALTLHEVAERHGGEVWYHGDRATREAYFRLLLPTTEPVERWSFATTRDSRPEYYDFDLFHQPGQRPELDERLLTELSYTVFDTETTGLDPSLGDEIVSIGAVRIVNGRLLQSDVFERLVDPGRPVSPQSVEIHGITRDLLRGKPSIDQVLPQFHRFAEDTVLVAHNAAFDMRFLQMKERETGVTFINPVLDTLLLSAVLHPNQEEHELEAIAARLGVNLIGRHTALGDAIVTGEIFLRMVPLLVSQGILTLRDAREASRKTYYARISY